LTFGLGRVGSSGSANFALVSSAFGSAVSPPSAATATAAAGSSDFGGALAMASSSSAAPSFSSASVMMYEDSRPNILPQRRTDLTGFSATSFLSERNRRNVSSFPNEICYFFFGLVVTLIQMRWL
jgi:hypothetical protein